jgi:hypothetical protein
LRPGKRPARSQAAIVLGDTSTMRAAVEIFTAKGSPVSVAIALSFQLCVLQHNRRLQRSRSDA